LRYKRLLLAPSRYQCFDEGPLCADIVEKVFLGGRAKILRTDDAFCAWRREGPYRFITNRSRTSVVALKSDTAAGPKINFREIFRVVRFSILLQQYPPGAVIKDSTTETTRLSSGRVQSHRRKSAARHFFEPKSQRRGIRSIARLQWDR
jgi:hypothetical protein